MGKRTCSIDGCEGAVSARGWCGRHYQVWRKYGDPEGCAPKRPERLCEFPECGRKHRANGYCLAHLGQIRKGVDPHPLFPSRGGWRYTADDSYFDQIDTPDKAYWLGFITADGCVYTNNGRCRLIVELKESDAPHLEILAECLKSNRPVSFSRDCATAQVSSTQLVEALARVGVGPRKSGVVEPWIGPAQLMRHYWRGMVDGDGSISPTGDRRKWTVNLVGSEACVKAFALWAGPIAESTASPRQLGPLHWGWAVTGTTKPTNLVRVLYRDAGIALQRKADLAGEMLRLY